MCEGVRSVTSVSKRQLAIHSSKQLRQRISATHKEHNTCLPFVSES